MSEYSRTSPWQVPVSDASVEARVSFLRRVGLLTMGGLVVSGVTAVGSAFAVMTFDILSQRWVSLAVMLGALFASRAVGGSLVASPDRTTRLGGFALGTALQGVAMGYLLLTAVMLSAQLYANPLVFLLQAFGLVGLTVTGMVAYLLTGPKNLSMVGSAMSTLALPMLGLMVFSWIFPMGGVVGILISVVFVALSAGGLLYNLNQVLHQMSTEDDVPAAYHVTLGVLTLFWNVLVLLMRLQRR
ncbi:MAG: Bax inhibitor-1 family protein [Myxococcota bacterium]